MMLSDVCLTSVAYIRSAGGVCDRPAACHVLADRARLGRPGSRLPLRASVAGLGGGISWRPPAYSLLMLQSMHRHCHLHVTLMMTMVDGDGVMVAVMHRSVMSADEEEEESRCCYERYRILVQNECAGGECLCLSLRPSVFLSVLLSLPVYVIPLSFCSSFDHCLCT